MNSRTLVFGTPEERVRLSSLVSLCARTVRAGWLSRTARFYTWVIAVTQGAILVFGVHPDDVTSASGIVPFTLRLLSWVGGAVAWAAARDLAAEDRKNGLATLATAHGASLRDQRFARTLATMLVVARAVALPAICLAGVACAVAPTPRARVGTVALALAVAVYGLLFGFVFGGLSRAVSRITPRHGRALFAAIVGVPLVFFGGSALFVSGFSSLIDAISVLTAFG